MPKVNIFEIAIKCMDATYQNSPADFVDNSEIVHRADKLIMDFRRKYEVPTDTDIGNADCFDGQNDGKALKALEKIEVEIFAMCWELMQEAMTTWGLGDIAREVFAGEILQVPQSWDVKNEMLAKEADKHNA